MSKIKVLVVDDSAFMRKVIKDMVESEPNLEVVGVARNGQEAIQKVPELKPDVVTLDVEMPVMDGLDTLTELVGKYKLPVIMLSSTTSAGAENTLIALERGAFDFIAKPSGSISLDLHKVKGELLEKIHLAFNNAHKISATTSYKFDRYKHTKPTLYNKQVINKPAVEKPVVEKQSPRFMKPPLAPPVNNVNVNAVDSKLKNIVLIGTSTGGPKALQRVLTSLPRLENTAVLIVQHMPASFTQSLAKRLDQLSPHDVVEASNGELIRGGTVYIAPGGFHMTIKALSQKKYAIHLDQEPPRGGHRPSVDVMYESATVIKDLKMVSVIMTGMGKDGTEGLRKLKQVKTNVYSIAEDESTCVVYGMPRSVVEANLINEIAPLDQIHLALQRMILE